MKTPLIALCALFALGSTVRAEVKASEANRVTEWSFTATKAHADPFNEVQLDAVFATPDGKEMRVPAFWAGGQTWRVRYASPTVGKHSFRTLCSDATSSLHGVEGSVDISAYTGDNPLFKHGPIRIAADKRNFEHADGTPFFWLGDTWWMGLCNRLKFPEDVKTLAADRKKKGFNVIQIVAGLYPDMHPFDPRGANEAGFPWEKEYARINPAYFDAADQRLTYLVDEGFTPCIVGAWGYFMPWMGVEKANKHWRYLIARYGAMPVTWAAAGEANLNWYLAKPFPIDDRKQVTDWTAVMRYIRATDPYRRPLTIHPTGLGRLSARNATDDVALLDFDMLQTPHGQREAVEPTVRTMRESYADKPVMPVINGEAAYEMLGDSLPTEWTRKMFWICMTHGAAGHTYGANGIWQVNRRGKPHGPSPHHAPGSVGYGAIPWEDSMNLPGSTHVALGAKLFQRFAWQKFQPHPEWAAHESETDKPVKRWGDWIWFDEGAATDAPIAPRRYRKTFDVRDDAKVTRAVVHLSADNRFVAYVNGEKIGGQEGWETPRRFDIAPLLKPGRNVLAVEAENVASNVTKNPAGLICAGAVTYGDGKETPLSSDATWKTTDATGDERWTASDFADTAWRAAAVLAKYGQGPWPKFGEGDAGMPPYATGIPGEVRVIYVSRAKPISVKGLERKVAWQGEVFNPLTGETTPLPKLDVRDDGTCLVSPPTNLQEWVLVMQRQ
ncbi:MAG: DUF4038 domain-containing protein [Planctomycetota bacterium]|nr:DUF4038 domain-containing protein [Planctomycetota bacterium]